MLSKDQLSSIFRRNGSSGKQTIEFDKLSDCEKNEVMSFYEPIDEEQPVLFHRGNEWIIITDIRVIFGGDGLSDFFLNSEIKSASFDRLEAIRNKARTTSDLDALVITLHDGQTHHLRFEPGQPL